MITCLDHVVLLEGARCGRGRTRIPSRKWFVSYIMIIIWVRVGIVDKNRDLYPKYLLPFLAFFFLALVLVQYSLQLRGKIFLLPSPIFLNLCFKCKCNLISFLPLTAVQGWSNSKTWALAVTVYLDLGRFILMPWFSSFLAAFACTPRSGEEIYREFENFLPLRTGIVLKLFSDLKRIWH